MRLLLQDLPPNAERYLLSLVRQDIRKMDRSHPKLKAKFGDLTRATERYAYVQQVYSALKAADPA